MPDGAFIAYTRPEHLLRDFASRGLVALAPEVLGVPSELHDAIYRKEREAFIDNRRTVSAATIPEILDVVNAPGVVSACEQLAGRNYAIVPFTHNAPFASGAHDQHWHKDDNGPFNARKQRHHHAVQIEMLYYPQEVSTHMGPTATVPYSQYWAFNHEENQDNFAGADHLDFGYHLEGMERVPVSGPESAYSAEDIAQQRTRHDDRMRQAVVGTGWPLARQFEVGPLRAGSVVLYSHNMFHRGNHRRDDWRTWKERPRFMWRFWLYRTTEPERRATAVTCDWRRLGSDAMTKQDLANAPHDAICVWDHHLHWLQTGETESTKPRQQDAADADGLFAQLHVHDDCAEPVRIGAAYRLAALDDRAHAAALLGRALASEREAVRRAAAYGLVALGSEATEALLAAVDSPVKWVRKAALFGLGDAATPNRQTWQAVSERLAEDPSVYVRSVAASALGSLGRRAIAAGLGEEIVPLCLQSAMASLEREENRLAMNIAQKRHIKIVRPTDQCDVCEGIGINYGLARFKPVRSAVRENALWSTVILCSHGARMLGAALEPLIECLARVVREDANLFSVGSALDALNRLARLHPDDCSALARERFDALAADMPLHSWESLARGGLAFDPRLGERAGRAA